jgi:hypothetical protein
MTASEGRLFQVDVIVLDEVHYLSDISRGTVWEETVCIVLLVLIICVHVILLFSYFHHILGHILSKGSPAYMLVSYCCKS